MAKVKVPQKQHPKNNRMTVPAVLIAESERIGNLCRRRWQKVAEFLLERGIAQFEHDGVLVEGEMPLKKAVKVGQATALLHTVEVMKMTGEPGASILGAMTLEEKRALGAWLDRSYRQGELDEHLMPLYRSLLRIP